MALLSVTRQLTLNTTSLMVSSTGVLFSSRLTDYNLSQQHLIHIVFIWVLASNIYIPRMADQMITTWTLKHLHAERRTNFDWLIWWVLNIAWGEIICYSKEGGGRNKYTQHINKQCCITSRIHIKFEVTLNYVIKQIFYFSPIKKPIFLFTVF